MIRQAASSQWLTTLPVNYCRTSVEIAKKSFNKRCSAVTARGQNNLLSVNETFTPLFDQLIHQALLNSNHVSQMETLTLTLTQTMIHAITVASITSCAGSRVICPHPCAWCGPAPALWRPVCLASSSCRRHEYSQCTQQTERDTDRETDVRQHHCLMPPSRGRGHNNILSSIVLDFSSVL